MNSKKSMLAVTTAVLLTAATVTAASAQNRDRSGGPSGPGVSGSAGVNTGQNLGPGGPGGQMNAQGQQFRQRNNFSQNEGTRLQGNRPNNYGMTTGKSSRHDFDRDRRMTYSGVRHDRDFDRRVGYAGVRHDSGIDRRVGYSTQYRTGGDRYAYGGWNGGWNGGWGGWGGPSFGVSVGYGGWPGYDYGYGYGYPGLYSYSPGYVGAGFGGTGCTCGGGPGWW